MKPPNEATATTQDRRWRLIEKIWAEAAHVPAAEREAWLRRACGGDAEVEAEVRALLQAGEEVGDRFERLIDGALGELDEDLPPTEIVGPSPNEREDATESSDLTGMRFGYVRIQSRLGQGGMGRVYRGIDERLGRKVALKVLRPEMASNPRMAKRLHREAQLLSQLQHPMICQIYDVIEKHGAIGLVLELVEGQRLSSKIVEGVDRAQALEWTAILAEVLAAAHEAGIVHRDLKPGNVMVTPSGELKVLDFGIARTWDTSDPDTDPLPSMSGLARAPEFTHTGEVLGTLLYMSPEQARGEPVSPATDIFSLGLILHELLAGRAAYAPTRHQSNLSRAILGGEVPSLDDQPAELSQLLQRLTAAAPGARPSARDVAERLRAIQQAPRRRRRRILQRTAAGVVLVLALATTWQARRAAEEAVRARDAALTAERMAIFLSTMFQSRSPWRYELYPEDGAPELETDDVFLRGLAKLEEGLEDEPALQARLLLAASEVALDLELDERALRTAQRSLALRRSVHGGAHPEVAESLAQVADGLYFAGLLGEGLAAAREARAIFRTLGGPVTETSCWTLVGLSRIANEYGHLQEAEDAAREAAGECSAIWPEESPDHAETRIFVGQALLVRSQRDGDPTVLDEALQQFRSAAEIQHTHLGYHHPLVALSDASIARTLLWQGEIEKAEAMFRDSIQRLEMALGEDARETDLVRSVLAEALRLGGSTREALEIQERIVQRIEAESGPEHLDLLAPLRAWSRALIDNEDFAAAESRLIWALRIGQAHLPSGHWEVRELQVLRGQTLRALGRPGAAEAQFLEASRPEEPGVASQAASRARRELAALRAGFPSLSTQGEAP